MSPPATHSTTDRLLAAVPGRRVLAVLAAYYGVVTYQFVHARALVGSLPPGYWDAFGADPDAPVVVQYVDYLVSATVGGWGQSLWFNQSVLAALVDTFRRLALLASVAIVAAVIADRLWVRLDADVAPRWLVTYGVYVVVFVATFSVTTAGANGAAGFYLIEARQTRDLPLLFGARRLLALGFLVGALVVDAGRRYGPARSSADATTANDRTA